MESKSTDSEIMNELANILEKKGENNDDLFNIYEKILEQNPNDKVTLRKLLKLRKVPRFSERALKYLNSYLETNPEDEEFIQIKLKLEVSSKQQTMF